jgi:uroporphyrin-III C-methyltransferase / precorrin-2 dehydrogenase / sirohydrochlorin ferrochelatase
MTATHADAPLFPAFLQLRGKPVLVVGAGHVAKRKIQALLEAGADVRIVARDVEAEIAEWIEAGRVHHAAREFDASILQRVWLVIAASSDEALNADVAAMCEVQRIWCNVVDRTELCSFQVPARVLRGPLQIAISSAGAAPMLARFIREKLETELDESYGNLAKALADIRSDVRQELSVSQRREFFDAILQSETGALLRNGELARAKAQIEKLLARYRVGKPGDARSSSEAVAQKNHSSSEAGAQKLGRVALVGAGPGDPGLLTLRALRVLNLADVILADQLVSDEVLALARRDADIEYVGKRGGAHCTPQAQIHERMLELANEGKFVVRLKGGDPFVFGRGGEELEFLRAHGIAFEVVPGITAALACSAYSGVPLTHREHAQSVRLVTAHCKNSIDELDWHALAQERQTLVFYMGVSNVERIHTQLLKHGRAPDTDVLIVEKGSRPEQRSLHTTLSQLPAQALAHRIQAPSLLLVGEVAKLAPELHWFGEYIEAAAVAPVQHVPKQQSNGAKQPALTV